MYPFTEANRGQRVVDHVATGLNDTVLVGACSLPTTLSYTRVPFVGGTIWSEATAPFCKTVASRTTYLAATQELTGQSRLQSVLLSSQEECPQSC